MSLALACCMTVAHAGEGKSLSHDGETKTVCPIKAKRDKQRSNPAEQLSRNQAEFDHYYRAVEKLIEERKRCGETETCNFMTA